jgi:hypothetical protein
MLVRTPSGPQGSLMAGQPGRGEEPKGVLQPGQFKAAWGSNEGIPAIFSDNLFLAKIAEGYFHITFGQTDVPLGSPKDGVVTIRPLATYIVPERVLEQINALLTEHLRKQ